MPSVRDRVVVAAAALVAVATRLYAIGAPFGLDLDGYLCAVHGNAARNFARYGFLELRFVPIVLSGPVARGDEPMLHHPPLMSLLAGLAVTAFGDAEWVVRLVPTLAAVGTLFLVHAIGRRITPGAAAFATLMVAACPMWASYGSTLEYGSPIVFAALGTWLLWLRHRETGSRADLVAMGVCLLAGLWIDWFTTFVAVPIALDALLVRPRLVRGPLVVGLAGFTFLVTFLAYLEVVAPGYLPELIRAAHHRQSSVVSDDAGGSFTVRDWLVRHASYLATLYTLPGLALAAAGAALARGRTALHLAGLALMGALPALIFRQASFQHAHLTYMLLPAIALAAGLALDRIWSLDPARRIGAAMAALALGAYLALALPWTAAELGARHANRRCRDVGLALREVIAPGDAFGIPGRHLEIWIPVAFYADRAFAFGLDTIEELDAARAAPGRRAPLRHLVATNPPAPEHAPLMAALMKRSRARSFTGGPGSLFLFDLDVPPPQSAPSDR